VSVHSPSSASHIPALPPHPGPVASLPPHPDVPRLPPHVDSAPGKEPKKSATLLVAVGVGLVILASVAVLILLLLRRHHATQTREARERELAKGPKLSVVDVKMSTARREITLPGEVRAFNQATLYAKVSGYVSDIRVDRGDVVKKDDVLAVIESPEMRDDVRVAQANREYTQRNATRLDGAALSGVVTMVDRDNAMNAARQAEADLHRARTLLGYTLVRAPFDGVVTARYVDLGALVPAATSATQQAQPVVDLAEVDRVRVFVYLGQDTAPFVKMGDAVTLYQDERPAQQVPASVTRVSGALDPRTRTMQCEVDVDNRPWNLLPGTFVHVRIAVDVPPSPVVDNDALVTRDGSPHVAVVDGDGKVHYRAIAVGNDDGKTTRVESGLAGGETIGVNVPVEIEENEIVQPVRAKPGAGGGGGDADPAAAGLNGQAAGSPTTTPTSVSRPPPPGPVPGQSHPEPNITSDNPGDSGPPGKGSAKSP
jgi:membrane fusion protein (multidrug efflux system)